MLYDYGTRRWFGRIVCQHEPTRDPHANLRQCGAPQPLNVSDLRSSTNPPPLCCEWRDIERLMDQIESFHRFDTVTRPKPMIAIGSGSCYLALHSCNIG